MTNDEILEYIKDFPDDEFRKKVIQLVNLTEAEREEQIEFLLNNEWSFSKGTVYHHPYWIKTFVSSGRKEVCVTIHSAIVCELIYLGIPYYEYRGNYKSKKVNNLMLKELAKTHRPPDSWFEENFDEM